MSPTPDSFLFGPFVLKIREHTLLEDGIPVPVAPKVFEILALLVENHGHLVTRDTLMRSVWPDSFVEETNLTVNISILRKLLGEMPDGRPYIATVPKRGYRFDAPITTTLADTPPVTPPSEAPAQPPTIPSRPFRPSLTLLATAALLLLIVAAWFTFRRLHGLPFTRAATVRTLAVLPFQTIDPNPTNEYLGLGMTDALISRFGRLQQITVRPFSAVRPFQSQTDPIQAGHRLGVDAVLDGTIQHLGDQTRVTVHLLRVSDGKLLWTDSFDDATINAFALEDSISQKLVQALPVHLNQDQAQSLAHAAAPKSEAYALYTQGRFQWNKRTVQSVQQSISLFRQAIAADPTYPAAYAGLSDAYVLACSYGISFLAPQVAMPMAKDAVEKALTLDPASPEAHTSLAYIHLTYDWDFPAAESEFRRALALSPGYVNAHHWYSHELTALRRFPESHEQSEIALNLDPTDPLINEHMAWHHLFAREYDLAIPQATKAIELDPNFVQAHRVLALAYLYSNRVPEACAEFQKGVELSHDDPVARAYLARCYALSHREPEARAILDALERASTERYISAAEIAAVHAALNDTDLAFHWLDQAYAEHASAIIYLNVDHVFDPLRPDPRFTTLLTRLHLTP